ncbi:caspase family protein [Streptomyces sp. adm13(2018)]|uniref:HD domain-containing protein n=1 Tax=Streptomyces sp. adm13(2018) TaxID=2479007 RepID=UPI0016506934|nr:caspase family protein [Streptomyces sp. adm13(2018)]
MSSTTYVPADTAGEPEVTGRRRALLIGVGRTPFLERDEGLSLRYPPLDFVDRDIEMVGSALAESGYDVDTLHPGHADTERQDTTSGSIETALEEFLLSCGAGDTAFLYFSCHGVTVGEREYLLTADARPRADGSLFGRAMLEVSPEVLLGDLPAGVTVVVCLDTCRVSAPSPPRDKHETPLVNSAYRDVAWLHASGRGQPAYADPEKGSYFGIALSEALSRNSPPKTFGDVHEFVRNRVERLASRLMEPPPSVEFQCVEGLADRLVLCRGSRVTQRWADAISASVLWQHTSHESATHDRVKERLSDLAREVAKSRLVTDSALVTPWSDPDYPLRVVDRLGRLVEAARLTGGERLTPAETAALLAAPLLHEGIVAIALSELAALRPDRIDRREDGRGREALTPHDRLVCDAARDVSRAHSQVSLAAETLRQRHLHEPAAAADHWLRHRFIADWDRLWDRTGDYPAVDHLLDMVTAAVTAGSPTAPSPQKRTLIERQLRQVLAHVTVAPGSSPRIDDSGELRWNEHPAVPGNTWRARDLAYLVWLASLLAADPRRMSSVLVDHLGAHRRLVPADVTAALSEYRLESHDEHVPPDGSDGYDLAVDFLCPHPALHAALEELAATADASVRALRRSWREARTTAPDLLRGVPRKVTTEFLEPLEQQYTKPLERFRLAEDEIRPLLMGTQLYGDKMLAVRELYQNALDACRYRQLRTAYGERLKRCRTRGQEPQISFVQGYDAEDRPYIECHDTGTGMSRRKLTSMFARAGKRYEQDPDFVQERRNWRRAGIDPMPFNSRFGIGVFSYFMLAEEVVVTTATIDLHGNPSRTEAPLQATIQSGSGLLEIVETTDAPERGGTVVRLYLSADGETPPSLVETLRRLLWVSDHRVTALELDREGNKIRSEEWSPGELKASGDWPGDPAGAGTDAWLVQGKGQLLLDGVVVRNAPEVDGYIFNLRERDQPVPTVDRNGLVDYDEVGVEERLLAGVTEAIGNFAEVRLRWLWELALSEPPLAVKVFDSLDDDALGVLHATQEEQSLAVSTFRLREVGCLPFDGRSIRLNHYEQTFGDERGHEGALFDRWRSSVLNVFSEVHKPFAPRGYPLPQGIDALLFDRVVPDGSWAAPLRAAAFAGQPLSVAVRAQRRYAIAGVRVPEAADIRALDHFFPTEVMADLYFADWDARRPRWAEEYQTPAPFAPFLTVAAVHDITLSETIAAARDLVRSVPVPGWEEIPRLTGGIVLETEARALAASPGALTDRRPQTWQGGSVHPVDLLVHASSVEQREQLVERIKELEPLGLRLSAGVSDATLSHPPLTGDERRLLSYDIDGERPWVRRGFTLFDVFRRSMSMKVPLGRVVEQISDLTAATSLSAPHVPPSTTDWTVPQWVGELLPYKSEPQEQDPFGPWRVVAAFRYLDTGADFDALRQDLRHLDACGVLAPGCLPLVEASLEQITALDPYLVRFLDTVHPYSAYSAGRWDLDTHGLGLEPLTDLAAREKGTIGAQVDRLRALSLPFPLKIVDLPASIRALTPRMAVMTLFTEEEPGGRMTSSSQLSRKRLLHQARRANQSLGTAVRTSLAFRSVGGPALPGPFTGPGAERLENFQPTDFDLAAFDPGLLGPGTLGPLELVLVAGRFGWTLGETYDRYAPFESLGLDVTTPEPQGDERGIVPGWRDVIVLTERLTGRAPAIAGTVTAEHLVLCAEETEQSVDDVRSLFERYARLFSLVVSTPGGPQT